MTVRADILAGRAVILVNIQDNIDQALKTIRSKMRVGLNNIAEIGGDLFRGGLAGSLAAAFPVKEFVSFQDSMLFLQSKLKDTGVDVRELEKLIRELGRTTSFTSREVAEAGAVLAQAGLGAKVGPTLQPTLDLARASRIDIDTAGRILANVMASFNIDVDKASETASKLVTAARLGTTDVVDLGEALKYSITTFRQLGIPLEDALGMITQLSNVSMRASLAGTSLNAAFGNLSAKQDQLRELGVVITDFDLENPVSMFTKLTKALAPLSRQDQVATLSSLFNIRGGRGFGGIMLQDLEDLQMVIDKIRNAGEEAREMAILMDSQLGGVGRRALSAFQEAMISIGETTEGPLTKIGNNLQMIFQNIGNLTQANPRLVQTMLAIPPIALATGAAFLLMSTAISKVLMLIGPLLSANALLFKSLGAIAGANIKVAKTLFDVATIQFTNLQKVFTPGKPVSVGVTSLTEHFKNLTKAITTTSKATKVVAKESRLIQPNMFLPPVGSRSVADALAGSKPFANFPLVVSRFELDPKAFKLPTLQETFNRVGKGTQLTFGFDIQPLLPFNEGSQAAVKATTQFKSLSESLQDATKYAKGLFDSPAFAEGMTSEQRLARAVRSTLEVKGLPPQLTRSLRGMLDSAVSKSAFSGPKLVQRLFDFDNLPDTPPPAATKAVQKLFDFEDVIEKQFSIGRDKVIGRNASFPTEFVGRLGTPNTQAARQAAADIQNAAIRARQTGSGRNPFGWVKPLITDIKLLTPSLGKVTQSLAGLFAGRTTKRAVDFSRVLKVIQGRIAQFFTADRGPGLFAGIINIITSAWKGLTNIGTVVKRLIPTSSGLVNIWRKMDIVRILLSGFKGAWTAAKGLFTVFNGIRRAVFSLSGILLIVEGLILFGDKIPIVKDALEGLGRAFSNAFKNIGNMFREMGDGFSWFRTGFSLMFSGDIETGLEHIGKGFHSLGTAIKEGVWYTWRNFVKDIEPGALMIHNAVQGLIGVFDALVASIGASFGVIAQSGSIIVKSDGSLLELFQSIFSPENFKSFFTFTIQLIAEIGKGINTAIGTIAQALNAIKMAFVAIVRSLSRIPGVGSGASEALVDLDENAVLRRSLEVALKNMNREFGSVMTEEQSKMYHDTKRQLDALPYVNPFKDTTIQANNDLQKKIDEILDSVNTAIIDNFGDRPELNRRDRWEQEAINEFGGTTVMTPDFLGDELLSDEFLILGNAVQGLTSTLEEERDRLRRQIHLLPDLPNAPKLEEAKAQAASMGRAIKAVVGDFESTRYRQVQFQGAKLDEKRNELLEDIDEGIVQINDKLSTGPAFA